jgi:ABC-type branched-subunit amino acid transport system ATPase component
VSAELRTEGIAKAFGGVQALEHCTLTVPAGSITGLIGPNGSGKTTLFNVMTGYERPDAGQVYLGGRRITGASAQRVYGLGLGRTFQLTRIFPRLTLLENMQVATRRGNAPACWPGPAGPRATATCSACWSSPASPSTPANWPAPCPTGSASCSSWPRSWPATRPWSCSTSRPAG